MNGKRAFPRMPAGVFWFILSLMSNQLADAAPVTSLAPCPASPNCVSSLAEDAHRIDAFEYLGAPERAWAALRTALENLPRTRVVMQTGGYLHAETRSLVFRFVDELEFLLDADAGLIQVRSAARSGYSDFGVNRRRIERLRAQLQRAGVLK